MKVLNTIKTKGTTSYELKKFLNSIDKLLEKKLKESKTDKIEMLLKLPLKLFNGFNESNLLGSLPTTLIQKYSRQLAVEDQQKIGDIVTYLLNDLREFGTRTRNDSTIMKANVQTDLSIPSEDDISEYGEERTIVSEQKKSKVKKEKEEVNKKVKKQKGKDYKAKKQKGQDYTAKKKKKDQGYEEVKKPPDLISIKKAKTIMEYRLSDLGNLQNKITAVPNEALVVKIFTFNSACPKHLTNSFSPRPNVKRYFYDKNTLAAQFEEDGTGYILYPNRETAVRLIKGANGKKLVVYSQTRKDDKGNSYDSSPVAIFDDIGNGTVFDDYGKIRMNYAQSGGEMFDTPSKTPFQWFWPKSHLILQRKKDLQYIEADDPYEFVEEDELGDEEGEGVNIMLDIKKKENKKPSLDHNKKKPNISARKQKIRGDKDGKMKKKGQEIKHHDKQGIMKKLLLSATELESQSSQSMARERGKDSPKYETPTIQKARHTISGIKSAKQVKKIANMLELLKSTDERKRVLPPMTKLPTKLKPITDIKPLVMKITDHIALRVVNQQHIHIDFTIYPVHIKLHIGLIISPEILKRTDEIHTNPESLKRVPCYFEHFHRRTKSSLDLHYERLKMIRKGKNEKREQFLKYSYMMGTHIYLRKK